MYLAEARRRSRRRHSVPVVALSDTRLSTWEERDRAHVELINAKNDVTIVEWWDDAVREAIEDGFLKPGKLHESAYDYAVHVGLIQRPGAHENPVDPTQDGWEVSRVMPDGRVRSVVFVDQGRAVAFANRNPGSTIKRVEIEFKHGRIVQRPAQENPVERKVTSVAIGYNDRFKEWEAIGLDAKRYVVNVVRGESESQVRRSASTHWPHAKVLSPEQSSQFIRHAARENPVEARDHDSIQGAIKTAHKKFTATMIADGKGGLPIVYTPNYGKEQASFKRDPYDLYWSRPDKKPRSWEARQLFKKGDWYHWPLTARLVALPKGARRLTAEDWGGHIREASECGCDAHEALRRYKHNPTTELESMILELVRRDPKTYEQMRDAALIEGDMEMAATLDRLIRSATSRPNPVDIDSDGIPWVKIERNADDFEEVRAIAEQIGPIKGSRNIYKLMRPWVARQDKEHFCVVLLDIHSMLRGVAIVHIGGRDRVAVDPADVMKPAIDRGAKGLCILHNHPSGSAEHSSADASLTKAIKEACRVNDIAFIDHLVIGSGEYYSFADKKLHKVRAR